MHCYNEYFINRYVFYIEDYRQGRNTYNSGYCIKGSTSNEFEVDYYNKLEEEIELQYHWIKNTFFYSNAIGMILIEKFEQILIMVWSKLIKDVDLVTSMMFCIC